MRKLEIAQELDKATFEEPHQLILDGTKTGVRWNGNTKKELYNDPRRINDNDLSNEEEFAYILVSELDQELQFSGDRLTVPEMLCFYAQLTEHLEGYPD